jgi:hypothetical protein
MPISCLERDYPRNAPRVSIPLDSDAMCVVEQRARAMTQQYRRELSAECTGAREGFRLMRRGSALTDERAALTPSLNSACLGDRRI